MLALNCVSLSFRSADVSVRQRFAFSDAVQERLTAELLSQPDITECVILCTCNRTEVYYVSKTDCFDTVTALLAKYAGAEVQDISRYFLLYADDKALLHLFKVAAGIDSMVLGEDEILSQTKSAYQKAVERNAVGYTLNKIFQTAFATAKKIKTETMLSKTSVSVATLAANLAAGISEYPTVLVIGGSGAVGSTVLKNLLSHKNVRMKATFRRHGQPFALAGDPAIETIDYRDRYRHIADCDCVISATAGPHFTVTCHELAKHIGNKSLTLIDLAMPPDIEPSVSELDNVRLLNIDYFKTLSAENNLTKLNSAQQAREMIAESVDALKKDLLYHDFRPHLDGVKELPTEVMLYRLRSDLTADAFAQVLRSLGSFIG